MYDEQITQSSIALKLHIQNNFTTQIPEQISDDDEQGDDDTPKAPLLNGKAKVIIYEIEDQTHACIYAHMYECASRSWPGSIMTKSNCMSRVIHSCIC